MRALRGVKTGSEKQPERCDSGLPEGAEEGIITGKN